MRRKAVLIAVGLALAGAAPQADVKLTQASWARMLADRMGIRASSDTEAVALLGGRGGHVDVSSQSARLLSAEGNQRSWKWDVTVPNTAIWLVTIDNRVAAFVSVDKSPSALVPAARAGGLSDAGRFPLTAGTHVLTVAVAQNVAAPEVKLVGGCAFVEPPGGWTNAQLTYATLARTLVAAMRQQSRLPAAEALASTSAKTARISAPAEGVYTVLFSGRTDLAYRLDGCEETRLLATVTADGWREGGTTQLSAGEHAVTVTGAVPADLKVRLVRRSTSDADYLGVLQAMGVRLQPVASLSVPGVKTASIVGGPRHAQGDASLAGLASRTVTRAEAERILAHPAIARNLANASRAGAPPTRKKGDDQINPLQNPLTYPEPVSPTLPGGQLPDPL